MKQFRYWLRINGFRSEQFRTGTKWNSIKLKSRKKWAKKVLGNPEGFLSVLYILYETKI